MTRHTEALASLVAQLARQSNALGRFGVFAQAVIREGGTMILPRDGDTWGATTCILSLHGVFYSDDDPHTALDEWTKCARRMIENDTIVAEAERMVLSEAERIVIECPAERAASDLRHAIGLVAMFSHDRLALDAAARLDRALSQHLVA
jgi:hypothetical protein